MAGSARQSAAAKIKKAVALARKRDRKKNPQDWFGDIFKPKKKKKINLGAGGKVLTPAERGEARKILDEMGEPTGSKT